MIPKIIHYCWFGGKRKPRLVRDCIKSWKKYLPDYEIIEWNEKNSDLTHPFVQKAYQKKKWAFVSDYVRLKVLYKCGGIYMDTDVMVIKPLDNLLFSKSFFGAEDDEYINCAIIGSIKNNEFIKECISCYQYININDKIDWGMITIPRIVTDSYRKKYNYFLPFNQKIDQDKVVVYPSSFFYPLPYDNRLDLKLYKEYLSLNSYTVHLWSESWIEYSEFHYIRSRKYKKGLNIFFKKILIEKKISLKYLRKILSCFKESIKYKND